MSSTTVTRNACPALSTVLMRRCNSIFAVKRRSALARKSVFGVGGDAVVVIWEGNLHACKLQSIAMLCLVLLVREEGVRQVDRAAGDVNSLKVVDERLVEALDVVVVQRADNEGEGRLSLREEIFGDLRSGHDWVSTVRVSFRCRGRRGGRAVVSVGNEQW